MAESMTYDSLIEDIPSYAERDDAPFVDQIPRFVMLAENRIASEVRGLGYLRYGVGTFGANVSVIEKPARWREMAHVRIIDPTEGTIFLKQRSYTFCRTFWPVVTEVQRPEFYCDYDYEHYLLAATPDADYPFEIAYYERPEPLDETNQTNWTTRYAPQLILYATLMEAQPFLKMPERTAEFESLYGKAAAAVTREAERRMYGDQALQRTEG